MAAAGCDGAETPSFTDGRGSDQPAVRATIDETAVINPATSSDGPADGLWITVKNRLPIERRNGEVISMMYLSMTWLEARPPDDRRDGDGDGDEDEAEAKDNTAADKKERFRLNQSILADGEQTFYLTTEEASALYRAGGGELRLLAKDSGQISRSSSACVERMQLQEPGRGVAQRITVEVRDRHTLTYGCKVTGDHQS